MPASVYHLQPGETQPGFNLQEKNGVQLADSIYLRTFPVWFDCRGMFPVQLGHTLGLAWANTVLHNADVANLIEQQLQWTLGSNPFNQSLIFGGGFRFTPTYTATSGGHDRRNAGEDSNPRKQRCSLLFGQYLL